MRTILEHVDYACSSCCMNDLHSYLPLSSCPGMTISSFAMTLRGREEGGGGPGLNVIMTLIFFFNNLEVSP